MRNGGREGAADWSVWLPELSGTDGWGLSGVGSLASSVRSGPHSRTISRSLMHVAGAGLL